MSYNTIIRPIVTEKTAIQQEKGKYTFAIGRSATKIDVKQAMMDLYGVEAKSVKIMVSPKKVRIVGRARTLVKRPITKKAIVTLKAKESIDTNKILDFKEPKKKK